MLQFPYKYLAIEGNIGAGKTSLARMIASEYEARLILEEFEDNSFLPKFYKDPDRYAFPLELSFLADRFQQLKDSVGSPDMFMPFTVSDYIVSKSLIFARKTLQDDEYALYSKLFDFIHQTIIKPDMLVYLYVTVEKSLENIKKRGRDYEQNISAEYLQGIQESYFDYLRHRQDMRVLIIDTNALDFVHRKKDYRRLKSFIFREYEPGIHRLIP